MKNFFTALVVLLSACTTRVAEQEDTLKIGVLRRSNDDSLASPRIAVGGLNQVGGVNGSLLEIETVAVTDFDGDAAAALDALMNVPGVVGAVSYLDSIETQKLAPHAEEKQYPLLSPLGSEFWAFQEQDMSSTWNYGVLGTTVGVIGALIDFHKGQKVSCDTLGVVLADRSALSEEQRMTERAAVEAMIAAYNTDAELPVTLSGIVGFNQNMSASEQSTALSALGQIPACVLSERGVHAAVFQAALDLWGESGPLHVFVNIRDASEFDAVAGLALKTEGQLAIQAIPGGIDLRLLAIMNDLYIAEDGTRPTWRDQYYFDAAMVMMLAISNLASKSRSAVRALIPSVASNDPDDANDAEVEVSLWDYPFVIRHARISGNADYNGVTGAIQYDPARGPVPKQRYRLATVDDLDIEVFTDVGLSFSVREFPQ